MSQCASDAQTIANTQTQIMPGSAWSNFYSDVREHRTGYRHIIFHLSKLHSQPHDAEISHETLSYFWTTLLFQGLLLSHFLVGFQKYYSNYSSENTLLVVECFGQHVGIA